MAAVGELLRSTRLGCGLTQADLARRAGLSTEGVSLIERGRRTPRLSTILLLADAMALSEADRRTLLRSAQRLDDRATATLPFWPDDLIGRDQALLTVTSWVEEGARLVTVTGTGGVGKTRLAVTAVRQLAAHRADGVLFLSVSEIRDPRGWYAGMASALGYDGVGSLDSIVGYLADQHLVLVLDHAEDEVARCRLLLTAIYHGAPGVHVLATSRCPLRLPQERVYRLGPLAMPASTPRSEAELASSPAGELFLRRATRPDDRELSSSDVRAIDQICRQVDALPLAVELAASHTDVMALPELAQALAASLSVPRPARAELELDFREPLLHSVVGWSYEALAPSERDAFAKLSVFAGSFREYDAQQILDCGPAETRERLSVLLSSSLLWRGADLDGLAVFRMLRLVRAVAADHLARRPDAEDTYRRHAEHITEFVEAGAQQLTAPDADQWMLGLDRAAEDCDRALAWSCRHAPTLALRLAGSLDQWCYLRGRYAQGRAWAAEALAADDMLGGPGEERLPLRARALAGLGGLAFLQCDYAAATESLELCTTLFHRLDNSAGEGWALGRLGSIARERGDYSGSARLHQRALELARVCADRAEEARQLNLISLVRWLSGHPAEAEITAMEAEQLAARQPDWEPVVWAAINRGVIFRLLGRLAEGDAMLARAYALSEDNGFPEGMAWSLNQRGVVSRLRGDHDRARRMQDAARVEHQRLGDRWREASTLEELAVLAVREGNVDGAALHLGNASHIRKVIGAPVPTAERAVHDEVVVALSGGGHPMGRPLTRS